MLSKLIAAIALTLIANTVMAQDANTTLPASFFTSGPAIESGAFRAKYEEAQAEVQVKDRLITDLRGVIETFKASRCPCCESGECQCGKTAEPYAKITMETVPWYCEKCEEWWRDYRPVYESKNWKVDRVKIDNPQPGVFYPRWRICVGDYCTSVPNCRLEDLFGKVQAILAKRRNK